ncbi:hypothetical protein AN958_09564 [Leucoagaricus sp. SymC.cos]|nr:hypothetical protein AN958_09564 [Leucoagaricus sp. SymC.cos]
MRFFSSLALALPVFAAATPTSVAPRWNRGNGDTSILNFELALEQLENAFYDQGLGKFDENTCRASGFPNYSRGRFEEIRQHELVHAAFLREAIRRAGADTVEPCRYRFPLENPATFAQGSLDISTIVAAAYTGALGLLENREYRVTNGQILSVESRQASWVNSALFRKNPWNTAFDTALTLRQAWSALSRYIESCPGQNAELVPPQSTNPFPRLDVVSRLVPGQRGQVRFQGADNCEQRGLYVVFKTGLQEVRAKLQNNGFFIVPQQVANTGANFIFVTSNSNPCGDENIVAGPTIYQFSFGSYDNTGTGLAISDVETSGDFRPEGNAADNGRSENIVSDEGAGSDNSRSRPGNHSDKNSSVW